MSDDRTTQTDPTDEETKLDPAATVELPAIPADSTDEPKVEPGLPGPNLDALSPVEKVNVIPDGGEGEYFARRPGFMPYVCPVPVSNDHVDPGMHVGVHSEEPETRFGGHSDFGHSAAGKPLAGEDLPEDGEHSFGGNTQKTYGVAGLHFRSPHGGF